MRRRAIYITVGAILLAIALFMPTAWYDTLPKNPDTPPLPFRGITLLRLTFFVEAVVVFALAATNWSFRRIQQSELLQLPRRIDAVNDLSPETAKWALLAITAVAIALRIFHLSSDLWIDEITPIVDYSRLPVVQVIGSYLRTNNHLLNTLLVKWMIGMFGEHEWSVRIPAMLFGAATIPVMYWLARLVLSRWASLTAAAVLAVSYHHILFSQNARGYSAYVFFSMLSAALLIRSLADDNPWRWAAYAVALFLGFASLAHTAFVFASHAIIGAIAVALIRRRGGSGLPLARRLLVVLGIAGFLSFQLYSAPLPEMYAVITHLYVTTATGYSPASMEFARELIRGVSAGFGGVFPAVIIALIGFGGIAILLRANWLVTLGLALPPTLTGAFLAIRGLSFSPRFFLLLLPLGILTILALSELPFMKQSVTPHPKRAVVVGLLLAAASIATLPHYYRTPKQSYRAAIKYIESTRTPDQRAVVVYAAETGFRYYTKRVAVRDSSAYEYSRSRESFDSLTAPPRQNLVVTTLPRVLRGDRPAIADEIDRDWIPVKVFPATIGGGEITVWKRKQSAP